MAILWLTFVNTNMMYRSAESTYGFGPYMIAVKGPSNVVLAGKASVGMSSDTGLPAIASCLCGNI